MPPTTKHDVEMILVAHDVSPADLIQLKPHQFSGILTDLGGATSHTSIVARSLNTPCVVGLHHARELIKDHDMLIVDGEQGVVIVDPDKHLLADYKLRKSQWELERQKLKRLKTAHADTLDGTHIELHANIEMPHDLHGSERKRCHRHRPVPQRVPVPQPRQLAGRGRAIQCLPRSGRGHGRPARYDSYFRSGRGQADQGRGARCQQSGAGLARHPLVPGRAATVSRAVARVAARFGLRQSEDTGADVVGSLGDQPDSAVHRRRKTEPGERRHCRTIRKCRSAA